MPNILSGPSLSAVIGSGTVSPSRFVSYVALASSLTNPTGGFTVEACPSGGTPCGISEMGSQLPPDDENYSSGNSWATGQLIGIYGVGRTTVLELGSTVSAGQTLSAMADGTGRGVPQTASNPIGAIAKQGGVSGDLIQVVVEVN
jgi:hypothetical protein